jgi:hypothetical protein
MTATRVTYVKTAPADHGDYVDARYDVLLDGVKVGEVTRQDRRTARRSYAGSRLGYDTVATAWLCEGPRTRSDGTTYQYSTYGQDFRSRVDAVIDFLTSGADAMTAAEARAAVGKRSLFY